jgi:hypothetical protein
MLTVVHPKNRSHEMGKRMVSEVTAHIPVIIPASEKSSNLHIHMTASKILKATLPKFASA